ncbi:hypothetical protein [Candidatus Binatus sp.]|uniref:hypothetical protein n=1 Tax=Candidatus Binatus sp. TaxID=2811406 RepID=UPI003C83576C
MEDTITLRDQSGQIRARVNCEAGSDQALSAKSLTMIIQSKDNEPIYADVYREEEKLRGAATASDGTAFFCSQSGALVVKFPKAIPVSCAFADYNVGLLEAPSSPKRPEPFRLCLTRRS